MTWHDGTAPTEPRRRLGTGWVIVLVVVGVGLVTAAFVLLSIMSGHPFGYFSKEPAETLRVPRIIGWQAYTIWWIEASGAAVALFSAWLVRHYRGPGAESAFLLGAGIFSCLLLMDDMYQFHDYVFVRFFALDERIVYAVYAALAVGLAWKWGRHVARQDSLLVLLAAIALAVSISVDQLVDKNWVWFHTVEDGAKMLGLSLWVVFQIRTGARMVGALIERPRPETEPDEDRPDDLPDNHGDRDESDEAPETPDSTAGADDPGQHSTADAEALTRPLPILAKPLPPTAAYSARQR